MLVRCVTLSLDRFENQVDVKGEGQPWCQGGSVQCGHPGVRHPASSKGQKWQEVAAPNAHIGGFPVDFLYCSCFAPSNVLPLMSTYVLMKVKNPLLPEKCKIQTHTHTHTCFLSRPGIAWDERASGCEATERKGVVSSWWGRSREGRLSLAGRQLEARSSCSQPFL